MPIAPWIKPLDPSQDLFGGINAGLALRRNWMLEQQQKQAQQHAADVLRAQQQTAMALYNYRQKQAAANQTRADAMALREKNAADLIRQKANTFAKNEIDKDDVRTAAGEFWKQVDAGKKPAEIFKDFPQAGRDVGVNRYMQGLAIANAKADAAKAGNGRGQVHIYHEPGQGLFRVDPDGKVNQIYDFGKMSPQDKAILDAKSKQLVNLQRAALKSTDSTEKARLGNQAYQLEQDIKTASNPLPIPPSAALANPTSGEGTASLSPNEQSQVGSAAAALTAPPTQTTNVAPVIPPAPDAAPAPNAPISAGAALGVPQVLPQPKVSPVVPAAVPAVKTPSQKSIDNLMKNPNTADQFDEFFGKGSAAKILTPDTGTDNGQ